MKLLKEKLVTLPKALDLLTKRQKEGELGYEQTNTLGYLQSAAKLTEKEAEQLSKELLELGVSERVAVMLANVLPKKEDEVRLVLASEKNDIDAEAVKNILKKIKEYKPSKE